MKVFDRNRYFLIGRIIGLFERSIELTMKFPLINLKSLIQANTKRQGYIITGILYRINYLVCLFFTPAAMCSILSCIKEFYGQLLPDDTFIASVKFVVEINYCNKHRKNRIDFIKADPDCSEHICIYPVHYNSGYGRDH